MNKYIVYHDGEILVGCVCCGHMESINASRKIFYKIMNREDLIQNILPDVSADIREMFQTGWCGCCYDLNHMVFPQKALKELTEYCREVMGDESIELDCNDTVIEMLTQYEWDVNEVPEIAERLDKIRQKIHELADRIDEGEFDKGDEDE